MRARVHRLQHLLRSAQPGRPDALLRPGRRPPRRPAAVPGRGLRAGPDPVRPRPRTSNSHVLTDAVALEVSAHHPANQRVDSAHVVISESGTRLYPVQIRYCWPSELDLMARWPASSWRIDGGTGGARPSPMTAPATCRSGGGRERARPGPAGVSMRDGGALDREDTWLVADAAVERLELDEASWVDVVRGLVPRPGRCTTHSRRCPLGARPGLPLRALGPRAPPSGWQSGSGRHPALVEVERWLSRRYRVPFDGVALVHYRDERDGVGFHRDRELRWLEDTVIGVLTLGASPPVADAPAHRAKARLGRHDRRHRPLHRPAATSW